MKQLIVKKGIVINEEVSAPVIQEGFILIKVGYSCISAGTEIAGVNQSGKSILKRALEKPEKMTMLINMLKSKGIATTLKQIKDLNEEGKPSGYSLSGVVIASGISEFSEGDRVAAAGGGFAVHAEYVLVPKNLVVKIPDDVPLKEASTATIGAIALHGVHRSDLRLGEKAVVVGCGILGLFTVQLLKAAGVQVLAIDINEKRIDLAQQLGADLTLKGDDPRIIDQVLNWSGGNGVDAVLFTASTPESDTLSKAFQYCRRKGKVVLVGVSGMEIRRNDIYPKEIDFLISTSYGPGRYDKNYEEQGSDYPFAYVRWTENRNIAEFLRLIKTGAIDITSMISSVFPFDKSSGAFSSMKSKERPLIVLLEYSPTENIAERKIITGTKIIRSQNTPKDGKIRVGLVGTGNFARNVHIPNLAKLKDKYEIHAVLSHKGYDAKLIAQQNNASYSSTEIHDLLKDDQLDLVIISTRHDSHADLALQFLKAGKNVFVEKPLAINKTEIEAIEEFYDKNTNNNPPILMVGFNRRFSPYAREIKKYTEKRINPLFIRYRMNAGYLPPDHWVFNQGGRIIGEACHIIDLMSYFTGSEIISVSGQSLHPKTNHYSKTDNKTFSIEYKDGSVATIDYFSNGNPALSKEFMEIHVDGKSIVLDDYKKLNGYGIPIKELKSSFPQKGHLEELTDLHEYLLGKNSGWPIQLDDMINTTSTAILIAND